ncbi:LamG-like jellyroll fold domain-containing protein [Paenibacillus septentrionalis]|uniref:LamG-like jellyroll fold domain-containing protein n=1 Tax=Paenibacillus septentrionalis TaxID=429342 RepID=A0ABW1V8A5_9BACL
MQRKSLKVMLCTFLAIVMLVPSGAFAAAQASNQHWASERLNEWERQDLLLPDYGPDQRLTRLDFVMLLNHVLGLREQSGATFSDVADEYAGVIDIAATAGYIKGYADGSFKPAQPITREEVAVILSRVFEVTNADQTVSVKDGDQLKSWSRASIYALLSEGYLNGYPDGQFKPQRSITTAEFVTMISNIVDVIITEPGTYRELHAKNILVTISDVVIIGSVVERNVYISSGAAGGPITIEDTTIGRRIIADVDEDAISLINTSFGEGPASTPTPSPTPTPSAAPTNPLPPSNPPSQPPVSTPEPNTPEFKEVSVHDPAIVKHDEMYYVFGTHGSAAVSDDLISWNAFGNGYATSDNVLYGELAENLKESFAWAGQDDSDSKGGFAVWAPDVIWVPEFEHEDGSLGAYLLYYSVSSTYIRSAIGVAASKTIDGPYQYVDTIVYSGFTNIEAYDEDSVIDKHWENTNIKQLIDNGTLKGVSSSWFRGNGDYNNTMYPNAIDANLYRDTDNKLWMNYGSWSGGIFVLEIDPKTGKAIYPGEDATTEDGRIIDRYFGIKISGGYAKSGEGPYIIYDEDTQYYYLFITYGWLGIDGEYNMRVFRSTSPTGPFFDASGQNAVLSSTDASNAPFGNKIMGHFSFDRYVGEPGSGSGIQYVSPGHNSVLFDEDGKRFVVFHTRFSQQVDGFQLRVHQLVMNEDGWLVATPHRYSGETLAPAAASEIIGEYRYINHGKDSSRTVHHSDFIELKADGSISGSVSGQWKLIDDYYADLTIEGQLYKGAFLQQWDSISQENVMVFTAMSNQGVTIWGSKLEVEVSIGEDIVNDLSLGNTELIVTDLNLPTRATRGVEITWTSSNPAVITNTGVVTRSYASEPEEATLTASFTVDGEQYKKQFNVTVKPIPPAEEKARYSFEGDLVDSLDSAKAGTVVGVRIDDQDNVGNAVYQSGISGQALYLDGETGVVLPGDLIDSYNYSVALWLNPDELNSYTTAFFGAADAEHWISVLPGGNALADTQLWHRNASTDVWFDAKGKGRLQAGDWTHVAFTVEEGVMKLYINGTLTFTGSSVADLFSDGDSIFSLAVNYWDKPYKGFVDELIVYNGILTESEILDLVSTSVEVTDIVMPITSKVLSLGQSYTPHQVTVKPSLASNPALEWSSSDDAIAAVDAETGKVTAKATGEVTITATSVSNSAISRSYTLHVVDGAIAHYSFDNDLGNKAVASGESAVYVGDRISSTTADAPVFDSFDDGTETHTGIVLDGSHGLVLPKHYLSDQTYTISLRASLETLPEFSTLFFAEDPSGSWISIVPGGMSAFNHRLMLWSNHTDGWFDGVAEANLSANTWTTITIAVDNHHLKIYVNGVLAGEHTNMPLLFNYDTANMAIGVNHWDQPIKGIIDELYMFDYALTEQEIAALH